MSSIWNEEISEKFPEFKIIFKNEIRIMITYKNYEFIFLAFVKRCFKFVNPLF